MTVLIYVDYMIIASNDNKEIVALKDFLYTKFRIIDLGQLQYFVRIEVLDLLRKSRFQHANYF